MTQRDKTTLLYLAGGLAGLAVIAYAVMQFYVNPLKRYNEQIANLEDDIDRNERITKQLQFDRDRLKNYYQFLSLPRSADQAAAEYGKFLKPLLHDAHMTNIEFKPQTPSEKPSANTGLAKKTPMHQKLAFQVGAKGTVDSLVMALEKMQAMPLAHRITRLTLQPSEQKDSTGVLKIEMTVEALIVANANPLGSNILPEPRLAMLEAISGRMGAPIGLAMALWSAGPLGPRGNELLHPKEVVRNYADVSRRNIFIGYVPPAPPPPPKKEEIVKVEPPPPPEPDEFDMLDYVRLAFCDPINKEAFLRNYVVNEKQIRLRPESLFTIRIVNEKRTRILRDDKVLRIDQRDVYFLHKNAELGTHLIYRLHIGQTLREAKPLSDEQLEAEGLMQYLPKEEKKTNTAKQKEKAKL